MTTLRELVGEVIMLLEGYGLDNGRATFLTAALDSSTKTFQVSSTQFLSEGLAEIDDELIYISAVDDTASTITLSPDGRGYRGTAAAAHDPDARLTMLPAVPRVLAGRKINETIVGVFPKLFGRSNLNITYDPVLISYEVPADCADVVAITYQDIGPTNAWFPVRRWRLDHTADTVSFPSGKALSIFDDLGPVTTIRVDYQKQPTELTNFDAALTTTGLSDTAKACIVTGAAWRLISFIDPSRLRAHTAILDQLDERNPVGAGTQVSSYLRKQYERELSDEQDRQQFLIPPIIHYQE